MGGLQPPDTDNMQVPAKVIALALVILMVVVTLIGYIQRSPIIHIALVAFPFLLLMMSNPGAWFVAIMGLERSGLIFPGIPQGLQIVHVMMTGFVALMIARNIILKPPSIKWSLSEYAVYAFLLIIGVTIAVRGFGLRALGGESWGGMGYIKLFVAAGLFLTAKYIRLNSRQIKMAIVLMLLLSFVPAISQVIFIVSGGSIYQQYMFVQAYVTGLVGSLIASETGRGVVRLQMFSGVATNLLLVSLILIPFRGAGRFFSILGVIGAFVSAGLSGFRGNLMLIAGILVLYVIFISEKNRMLRLVQLAVPAVAIYIALIFMAESLPLPAQRAVSWFPLVETAQVARMDAEGSSQWRVEVWKLAWQEVPRYLWIGKGYALDPGLMMSPSVRRDSILTALATQDYHNGPLSLLLVFGLPGLLVGSSFLILSSIELIRRSRTLGDDPFIRRFYYVFLARYLYLTFSFFFVFGDARDSFVQAFVLAAFLGVTSRSQQPVEADVMPVSAPARPVHERNPWAPSVSYHRAACPTLPHR